MSEWNTDSTLTAFAVEIISLLPFCLLQAAEFADLLPCFSSCVGKICVVSSRMCSRLRAASWTSLPWCSWARFSSRSPSRRLWRSILSLFSWWRPARRCSRRVSSWERRSSSRSATRGGGSGSVKGKQIHHNPRRLTALHLLVAQIHRLLQLLNLYLAQHDLPFLTENSRLFSLIYDEQKQLCRSSVQTSSNTSTNKTVQFSILNASTASQEDIVLEDKELTISSACRLLSMAWRILRTQFIFHY